LFSDAKARLNASFTSSGTLKLTVAMSAALLVELFNNNSRGRLERQFRDRFLDLVGNFINTATY
jgi:hypothetical protein